MSHCLILQHDPAFGPGRVVNVFRDFGIPTRTVRLDQGEPVPDDFDEARLLVLLGGTQRLIDGESRPDWLDREVEAVRPLVMADRAVLGFGLGAQIIAKAAGGAIAPNASGENEPSKPFYGWAPVKLPFPGGTDPILFGLHDGSSMFYWHKDSLELPKLPPPAGYDAKKPGPPPPTGSVLLASSPHCRNAAFRFKERVYGFQFHPELDQDDFEQIASKHGGMAGAAFGSGEVGRISAETSKRIEEYRRLGTRVLKNYVQYFKAYNPAGVRT
jgi:GMP synthase-like glutamine amidotransferase